ncbi:MAG TPA: maleylpyruvate isomerase N-terminal domain-containing protein, partial [Methylomirabilota bacterium]|nr:maleylpyruvate isomerase N-terminal domain-containing protein [Methylomirabilota bacterium]
MNTTIRGTSKDELLGKISATHRSMREAIGALPAPRWDEKLPAGWTLKEMVGHLAYWESTIPAFVESARSGTPHEDGDDADELNARAAAEARGLSREEILRRWDDAHAAVLEVARNLTDSELADDAFMEKFEGDTYGHYPNHYADLGAVIKDKDDLLALVQTPWTNFRLAIGSIGLPGLEEKTSTGWTYKDLAAHAAAWEDRTASRLGMFRESGSKTDPGVDDTDEFNRGVVERTRGRDAGEILRELDSAHGRIIGEIGKLNPEQIHANDDWIIAIVAGNTYGHYAEHFDEVFAAVPKRPAELLGKMREGWRPFRRALNRLGLSAVSETTPSGWTYKGMLGHVANWMEKLAAELPNRLEGRRGPFPDVDGENAREAEAGESRSAHEVVERVHAAYKAVADLVTALPADRDINFLAIRLVVGETYDHFAEHVGEIEAALPRNAAEYAERIEKVWKPFRAAIRERGRAGLGQPTSSGWTYKDLVAHAVGWMHQAVREMDTKEFRTGWTSETIQEFNDRSVRTHELVGPEAIIDELDTVYR